MTKPGKWLARAADVHFSESAHPAPDKTDKTDKSLPDPPSVGFVGTHPGAFSEIESPAHPVERLDTLPLSDWPLLALVDELKQAERCYQAAIAENAPLWSVSGFYALWEQLRAELVRRTGA